MLGYTVHRVAKGWAWLIHTHTHTDTHTHTVKRGLCSFYLKMIWKRKLVIWQLWSFLSWSPLLPPVFCAFWPKRFQINLFCPAYWQSTSWFMPPMILSSSLCLSCPEVNFYSRVFSKQVERKWGWSTYLKLDQEGVGKQWNVKRKRRKKNRLFYFPLLPHMTGSRTCCVCVHLP